MTISSTTNRVEYNGNGVTTAFAFGYLFIANGDLKVYLDGTLKTITTHYTVTGAGDPAGGTVTFLTAPAAGTGNVVIVNDPAITQGVDLVENDPLPAASLEGALDRLTIVAQRLDSRADRALHLADDDVSGVDPELPTPVASQVIGFNSAGTALQLYPRTDGTIADGGIATAQLAAGAATLAKQTDGARQDVTCAATIDLDATTSRYVRITGSTGPVTAITLGDGKYRHVVFASTPTLTHSASLILPGGVSITAAAGDSMIVVGEASSVVRVLQYTVAAAAPGATYTVTKTASTSGTSVDFTGIPSWARKVSVVFNGVGTNGTSLPIIQLGDSGGVENTGYVSYIVSADAAIAGFTGTSVEAGFNLQVTHAAADTIFGTVVLTRADSGGTEWGMSGNLAITNLANINMLAGHKTLSAQLDRIRVTTAGGANTFDAGAISVLVE